MELLGDHTVIEDCDIGDGTIVRSFVNLYGCTIGEDCKIASFVEIQRDVTLGDRCKVEAFAFIPTGVTIGDEVFIGPHAVLTNDRVPRAVGDWELEETVIEDGASIGAHAVVICPATIGEGALVAAGAVVTEDVPANTVVAGSPARVVREIEEDE